MTKLCTVHITMTHNKTPYSTYLTKHCCTFTNNNIIIATYILLHICTSDVFIIQRIDTSQTAEK